MYQVEIRVSNEIYVIPYLFSKANTKKEVETHVRRKFNKTCRIFNHRPIIKVYSVGKPKLAGLPTK